MSFPTTYSYYYYVLEKKTDCIPELQLALTKSLILINYCEFFLFLCEHFEISFQDGPVFPHSLHPDPHLGYRSVTHAAVQSLRGPPPPSHFLHLKRPRAVFAFLDSKRLHPSRLHDPGDEVPVLQGQLFDSKSTGENARSVQASDKTRHR